MQDYQDHFKGVKASILFVAIFDQVQEHHVASGVLGVVQFCHAVYLSMGQEVWEGVCHLLIVV